ncbi:MAG: substrate-binding domain-containing protein, partial [Woeseia sp.]
PLRIVKGENITQAYAMIATESVDYGLVARASVLGDRARNPASCWDVPTRLHTPLRQEAVLLSRAATNPAAAAFVEFLGRPAARAVIERHGYGVEP